MNGLLRSVASHIAILLKININIYNYVALLSMCNEINYMYCK